MALGLEIERRFVARWTAPQWMRPSRLSQGYVSDQPEIRVRKTIGVISTEHYLTVKIGEGHTREEFETPISEDTWGRLMSVATKTLVKLRYRVGEWEIDVYQDRFYGLVVAECEMETYSEILPEKPPGLVLVREVEWSNRFLAQMDMDKAIVFVVGQY